MGEASEEDEEEDDDDDEDEDEAIDPAERAAWAKFMAGAEAAAEAKRNKQRGGASKQEAASNNKKRKTPASASEPAHPASSSSSSASTSSAAAATASSSSAKKHKSNAAAAAAAAAVAVAPTAAAAAAEYFPAHFSRLDFCRLSPSEMASRFPLFNAKNGCVPLVVDVHAGDMLYLPAGWWHEVFSRHADGDAAAAAVDSASSSASSSSSADALPADVHMALNYWFQPPSSQGASFKKPYDSVDGQWERKFQTEYLPRTLALQNKCKQRELAQQQATKKKQPRK